MLSNILYLYYYDYANSAYCWVKVKVAQLCLTPCESSPWNSPGQNTGVGSLSLLQGIFPIQESNLGLLHCKRILYQLSYKIPFSLLWISLLILQLSVCIGCVCVLYVLFCAVLYVLFSYLLKTFKLSWKISLNVFEHPLFHKSFLAFCQSLSFSVEHQVDKHLICFSKYCR